MLTVHNYAWAGKESGLSGAEKRLESAASLGMVPAGGHPGTRLLGKLVASGSHGEGN